jgi:hypothetical protein
MTAPLSSWKNDTNYNTLSATLTNDYLDASAVDATYLSQANAASTYEASADLDADVGTAGYLKEAGVSALVSTAVASFRTETQVTASINDALVGYELSADVDGDVSAAGYLKEAGVSALISTAVADFQTGAQVSSSISDALTGNYVQSGTLTGIKSPLYDFIYSMSVSSNLLAANGVDPFNWAGLLAVLQ